MFALLAIPLTALCVLYAISEFSKDKKFKAIFGMPNIMFWLLATFLVYIAVFAAVVPTNNTYVDKCSVNDNKN